MPLDVVKDPPPILYWGDPCPETLIEVGAFIPDTVKLGVVNSSEGWRALGFVKLKGSGCVSAGGRRFGRRPQRCAGDDHRRRRE